jgi:hypothetical protein
MGRKKEMARVNGWVERNFARGPRRNKTLNTKPGRKEYRPRIEGLRSREHEACVRLKINTGGGGGGI